MPFRLHHGNDLAALARALAEELRTAPDAPDGTGAAAVPDPLRSEIIVTPDRSLARWLQFQIAAANGMCPHAEFLFPGKFLYKHLFEPMLAATPAAPPVQFTPDTVRWRILALLPELEDRPAFARVKNFTAGDTLRRYQIAGETARLFDKYMTYRPQWTEAWERGAPAAGVTGDDAPWQSELWRALTAQTAGETLHFSGLLQRFLRETAPGRPPPAFLNKLRQRRRVFYFGITALPPAHLDVLKRLADTGTVEIHFHAHNPCADLWDQVRSRKSQLRAAVATTGGATGTAATATTGGDAAGGSQGSSRAGGVHAATAAATATAATDHPLLEALGRAGSEFLGLLLDREITPETEHFHDFDFAAPADTGAGAAAPSLLTLLRAGVQENTPPPAASERAPIAAGDRSLSVHNCHSPLREVEVLRDQILDAFATIPDLQPEDIRVLAPSLDDFAPHIAAVFGGARAGATDALPWAFAGKVNARATGGADTAGTAETLRAILAAIEGRFAASEILTLLEHESVAKKFALSAAELAMLPRLLARAGAAWGIDAPFRERAGSGATPANTWRFALDRLLLGAAAGNAAPENEIPRMRGARDASGAVPCLPADVPEGAAETCGKLAAFAEALFAAHHRCAAAEHTIAEWAENLGATLASLLADDGADNDGGARGLLQKLRESATTGAAATANLRVPFACVSAWLREHIGKSAPEHQPVPGKILVARLGTLRNAPCRVLALLGMSDGALPRAARPRAFDLMESAPRRAGDGNPRDDDRLALLGALTSATERVIILHSGQSERDNAETPPCAPVCEILDAADSLFTPPVSDGDDTAGSTGSAGKTADFLTLKHPLHPFSPAYFAPDKDRRLAAFNPDCFAAAARLTGDAPPPPEASTPPPPPPPATPPVVPRKPVPLEDLIAFLCSPAKDYHRRRFGVRLDIFEDDLPDDDGPLELTPLAAQRLRARALDTLLPVAETLQPTAGDTTAGDAALEAALAKLRAMLDAAGDLPPDGGAAFEKAAGAARQVTTAFRALAAGARLPARIADIALDDGAVLRATFADEHAAGVQVFTRAGKERGRDVARAFLLHLARCAAAGTAGDAATGAGATHAIFGGDEKVKTVTYQPVPPAEARALLAALLAERERVITGGAPPPCFHADAGWALVTDDDFRGKWEGARGSRGVDASTRRLFGAEAPPDGSPAREALAAFAEKIFAPARLARGEV
ncbi:MAG: exodeoxyribonuclease V subunit gamma [Puniceicoccales bacterium]|jgi:exodeoxyribonuclease V gamma subunit|nr:exodeoxyribonuclease V subunit gamma [Puniceicoccales bacterium]